MSGGKCCGTGVAERFIESVRIYRSGFSKVVYAVFMLQPPRRKTRLYVYFGAVPKPLTSLALRLGFLRWVANMQSFCHGSPDEVRGTSTAVFGYSLAPDSAKRRSSDLRQSVRDLIAKGLDVRAVNQLLDWIAKRR